MVWLYAVLLKSHLEKLYFFCRIFLWVDLRELKNQKLQDLEDQELEILLIQE